MFGTIYKMLLFGACLAWIACGPAPRTPEVFTFEHDPQPEESAWNVAVIVEPREHPLLVPIVENMMQVLGKKWKIQIFHGTKNKEFIQDSKLKEHIEFGRIHLTQIDRENLTIAGYNALFLDRNFWGNVLGENVLIFQTDTVLCSGSKHKIENFMKYDYVGAPWDEKKYPRICNLSNGSQVPMFVGNGGLSFRKRSKSLKVLERFPLPTTGDLPNEDIFFSCATLESGSDFIAASFEEAKNFSVETVFNLQPFGVHKPWAYLSKDEINALGQSCPEIDTILKPHYKW